MSLFANFKLLTYYWVLGSYLCYSHKIAKLWNIIIVVYQQHLAVLMFCKRGVWHLIFQRLGELLPQFCIICLSFPNYRRIFNGCSREKGWMVIWNNFRKNFLVWSYCQNGPVFSCWSRVFGYGCEVKYLLNQIKILLRWI